MYLVIGDRELGQREYRPLALVPPPLRRSDHAWIDFGKTSCQSHPLNPKRDQPVERIAIPE